MTNEQQKAVQVLRDALAYARRTGLTNDQAYQSATTDSGQSPKDGMDVLSGGSLPADDASKAIPSGKTPVIAKK
jgi:hypothetical protein